MSSDAIRCTFYLDPALHRALRLKAASTHRSMSEIVKDAIRAAFREDEEDLARVCQACRRKDPQLRRAFDGDQGRWRAMGCGSSHRRPRISQHSPRRRAAHSRAYRKLAQRSASAGERESLPARALSLTARQLPHPLQRLGCRRAGGNRQGGPPSRRLSGMNRGFLVIPSQPLQPTVSGERRRVGPKKAADKRRGPGRIKLVSERPPSYG
jgi:plasmid stability protein